MAFSDLRLEPAKAAELSNHADQAGLEGVRSAAPGAPVQTQFWDCTERHSAFTAAEYASNAPRIAATSDAVLWIQNR